MLTAAQALDLLNRHRQPDTPAYTLAEAEERLGLACDIAQVIQQLIDASSDACSEIHTGDPLHARLDR